VVGQPFPRDDAHADNITAINAKKTIVMITFFIKTLEIYFDNFNIVSKIR
jgi:hypothetical protein